MKSFLCILFVFVKLFSHITSSRSEPPSFSEIFRKHDKEMALRRANELKIYDKEFPFYKNADKFPSFRMLQIGDDISFAALGSHAVGGGGNEILCILGFSLFFPITTAINKRILHACMV